MGAYYRVGQYYVDTSVPATPVLYRCTTAGDKSSSAWAKISGGAGGGGLNYRGVWTPGSFMTYDLVSLGSGTSSGFYLSLIDNNANSPDSGIGWVQVSSYATWL